MAAPSMADVDKWKRFSDLYELGRMTDAVAWKHGAREASKIQSIQNLISGFSSSVCHYQSENEEKEIHEYYCDVGSGNGDLSIAIGDSLLFPRKRIYMIDIPEWMEQKHHRKRENMVLLDPSQADFDLPFPDEKFRVMSCFMSIHHFKYPQRMMEQIYSKLKAGGYLIIREHDCSDIVVEQNAHFEHQCHYMICERQQMKDFDNCYYASYTSADALSTQLQSIGFQFIRKMEDQKPAHRNPSQHCWMLFRKKNKEREAQVEADSIRITVDMEAIPEAEDAKEEDEAMIC